MREFVRSRVLSKAIISIIVIFSFVTTSSQTTDNHDKNSTVPRNFEELKTKISSLMQVNSIPGAGIAIVSKDSVIFLGGLGLANMEDKIPVTEDTYFHMGSITKSFIALGFLKLAEEGRLDLNTPVKEIVPEINIINPWQETDPVRVVHVLEHTSGFGNSFREFNFDDDPRIPLRQALDKVADALEVRYRPGTCYSYSNTGYGLAGYILEKTAGVRYEDYLKEIILKPVGMESSTFKLEDHKDSGILARGYMDDFKAAPFVNFYSRSAGIMLSTAGDMAKYVQFMLNRGKVDKKQIISEASIVRMETPATSMAAKNGLNFGYGLGAEQSYRGDYKWIGHNGALFGFFCDFWYNCELNIGYVALLNRYDMSANTHVIRNVITDYLVRNNKPLSTPAAAISKEYLDAYTGHYARKNSTGELLGWVDLILGDASVSITGDTLYFQHYLEDEQSLIPIAPHLFREPEMPDASIIFFETPEGKRAMVNWNSYYEETNAWKPRLTRWFFIFVWIAMLSTIPYAFVWIPKRIIKGKKHSRYLRMRIFPLLSVVSILYGITMIAIQDLIYIAQMTPANVQFTISTWMFAVFSFISLFFAGVSFRKPVSTGARVYALVVSLSCVGMTLFLGYYGMIGLRLWSFS